MKLNSEQKMMLEGAQGPTIQKAIRLLIDLGKAANSEKLVPVVSAHVSGVSPLTGGDGLIQFLEGLKIIFQNYYIRKTDFMLYEGEV